MELELPDSTDGGGLPPQLESTIYRLVQEALTNVVKHARAHSARVAVSASASTVSIEVEDDGIGFSPDTRADGFGLAGMRERVFLVGGTLKVESGEHGTLVHVELPLAGDRERRRRAARGVLAGKRRIQATGAVAAAARAAARPRRSRTA